MPRENTAIVYKYIVFTVNYVYIYMYIYIIYPKNIDLYSAIPHLIPAANILHVLYVEVYKISAFCASQWDVIILVLKFKNNIQQCPNGRQRKALL